MKEIEASRESFKRKVRSIRCFLKMFVRVLDFVERRLVREKLTEDMCNLPFRFVSDQAWFMLELNVVCDGLPSHLLYLRTMDIREEWHDDSFLLNSERRSERSVQQCPGVIPGFQNGLQIGMQLKPKSREK